MIQNRVNLYAKTAMNLLVLIIEIESGKNIVINPNVVKPVRQTAKNVG
jgi:hypothetical protein